MTIKLIDKQVVYNTQWFRLVAKSFSNSDQPYYVVEGPDCVSILAVTHDDKVLLVRQFRPAIEAEILELPSGHIEPGETPLAAAQRELGEETGYQATEMNLLGVLITDTGRLGSRQWCFFAEDVRRPAGRRNEEAITVIECERDGLLDHIERGTLAHAQDIATIFLGVQKGKISLKPFTAGPESR